MLRAPKLYQSVSICGPSATAKPRSPKICDDLVPDLAHRMDACLSLAGRGGKRHVDASRWRGAPRARLRRSASAARDQRFGDPSLQPVELRRPRPCAPRDHGAERLHPLGDRRPSCRAPRRAPLRGRSSVAVPISAQNTGFQPLDGDRFASIMDAGLRKAPRRLKPGEAPKGRLRRALEQRPWPSRPARAKASGSRTARSARTLRSTSTPALSRPSIKRP